jgi:hypothetical protein
MAKALPKSLTDLLDTSRLFVERRAGQFELVSVSVKIWWEMRDGGPPAHIQDLLLDPQSRKEVVDRHGLNLVLRKLASPAAARPERGPEHTTAGEVTRRPRFFLTE